MATVNIANLTFTHRGDYDGSTAYAKNDVVYYSTNGNAYIAKQATTGNLPTSTAHWNIFSQGSGGIWNGGLSLGSANQVVKVNSSGNALEFGDSSGGIIQSKNTLMQGTVAINYSDGRYHITALDLTLDQAPTTGNKLLLLGNIAYGKNTGDPGCAMRWEYSTDNSTWQSRDRYDYYTSGGHAQQDANGNWTHSGAYMSSYAADDTCHASLNTIVSVADVSNARYFRVTARQTDSSNNELRFNRGHSVAANNGYTSSSTANFTVIELGA